MKRLLLAIVAVLGLPVVVSAQEIYSVNAPATDVNTIERERVKWNTSVCATGSLPASCTQAQICGSARWVSIVGGGASCTAVQARAVDIEIFANSQAGREGFFVRKLLPILRVILRATNKISDAEAKCINWRNGNDTVKNAMCAAAGAPVPATVALGCQLCDD